jgi:predicted transcriptional regulator YdeE
MQQIQVARDAIKLMGIQTRTNNQDEINSSSQKIRPCVMKYFNEGLANQILNRTSPGITICAYTNYEKDHTGNYTYFIGEEVDSFEVLPEGFSKLEIPAQTYIKFTNGPGAMPTVCINAWQKIWQMTPQELGGNRNYQTDFELYDDRARDHSNTTLDVYIGLKPLPY